MAEEINAVPTKRERRERLFFALWPSPEFARELDRACREPLKGLNGRRLPIEHLHITLRFMGAVDQACKHDLIEAASNIYLDAFTLSLDSLGFWPRPKVVWLGPSEQPTALMKLADALERACVLCGLAAEKRGFHAHMTLLRKARRGPEVSRIEPLPWRIGDFALVRSETFPEGVQYTVLQRWPLGTG